MTTTNSELEPCLDCGAPVSRSARACPSCGSVALRQRGCARALLILVGAFVVLVGGYALAYWLATGKL